jgi:hypothetical protein
MHPVARILVTLTICLSAVVLASIGAPVSSQNQVTARELISLASWKKQFKITAGKDRGKVVPLTSQPDFKDDARSRLVFGNYAAVVLKRHPGGALSMERLDLLNARSFVVYEPPLLVLPSDISSTGPMWRQTGYKMYNLDTGKLKRAGRVSHLVKRISSSQFDTPAGVMDGYYIEIDHRMEMEYYSQLHLTLGLGFRLADGPIYGSGQYTVKKLGVFSETRTAAAALANP